jgi:hypothetical protein
MIEPKSPKHADFDFAIPGQPRLTGRRHLVEYAYPQNGNVHNPTPRYSWLLLLDGNIADRFDRKRDLLSEATENAAGYLDGQLTDANTGGLEAGDKVFILSGKYANETAYVERFFPTRVTVRLDGRLVTIPADAITRQSEPACMVHNSGQPFSSCPACLDDTQAWLDQQDATPPAAEDTTPSTPKTRYRLRVVGDKHDYKRQYKVWDLEEKCWEYQSRNTGPMPKWLAQQVADDLNGVDPYERPLTRTDGK